MRLVVLIFAIAFLAGCKSRSDSQVASTAQLKKAPSSLSAAPREYRATAKLEGEMLTFIRARNIGDYLNLNVVRFAKVDGSNFELYGKQTSYPAIRTKCAVPGKDWSCDRDLKNPKFGERIEFGNALKFIKKSGEHAIFEGQWPCSKVIEFVSEKPSSVKSLCGISAKVDQKKNAVMFTVNVQEGHSLTGSGFDLVALPMPFVNQPLQKEVVLAAMKRIRERWPDRAIRQLGSTPLNANMGTNEDNTAANVIACNENFVPWWSDIVIHYYCQFPPFGIRECFTGSARGGSDFRYRPYFTPFPGLEGSSFGGAFDFCLHDGEKRKKTAHYRRFSDINAIPDDGLRGNFKWLALTPVVDDSGQEFLNSDGKAITHGDVFEYIMSSGVAIGNKLDLAKEFDKISGELSSKLFALESVWQEHTRKRTELNAVKAAAMATVTWVDPDVASCRNNLNDLTNYLGQNSCLYYFDQVGCESLPECLWDTCGATSACFKPSAQTCELISSKAACVASPECAVSTSGKCSNWERSGNTDLVAGTTELAAIESVARGINSDIDRLKNQLRPIRQEMHFNENFSTLSTFNNDDQQWVINRFYNLEPTADQKVCEPDITSGDVEGYLSIPDGSCCADSRFIHIRQEGRTAKVRFQRNWKDERGVRDNLCEKDVRGDCLTDGRVNFANICKSAPLPDGAVINNPEI